MRLPVVFVLGSLSLCGCTKAAETPPKAQQPKQPEQLEQLEQPSVDHCKRVAQLYPESELSDTTVRDAVVGRHWAHRDGGIGSLHGPPRKWRRTIDLTFEDDDGQLVGNYADLYESSDEEPVDRGWSRPCSICGNVMACGDETFTVVVREGTWKDKPFHTLDTDSVLRLDDHDLYLVRYGHEIHLDFDADPYTAQSGELKISMRALEAGAEITRVTTTFNSEALFKGRSERKVFVELPGDVGSFRIEMRGPDRLYVNRGSKGSMKGTLYDLEQLRLHPDRMKQPASLEIDPDAKGFNQPHR